MLRMEQFFDFELDGIDTKDYPDFVDAYICSAKVRNGYGERDATDKELDMLNEDGDMVHNLVLNYLF